MTSIVISRGSRGHAPQNTIRRDESVNSDQTARINSPSSSQHGPPILSQSGSQEVAAETPPSSPPEQQPSPSSAVIFEGDDEDNGFGFPYNHPSILILLIFLSYLALLYFVYLMFPQMKPEERQHIKVPRNLEDAKNLANVLDHYKEDHYYIVLLAVGLLYLFLQTFAIPGSIFLSIMCGFLFSFWVALTLVCICATNGATCCYMLSWLIARPLVESRFADTIQYLREKVNNESDNLLNFIIFLRITPILPNWIINIVAPHIGVPVRVFWLGSLIGVAPPSALAVQAGRTLNMMTSPSEHLSWTSICFLAIIAGVSLLPVVVRRWSQD